MRRISADILPKPTWHRVEGPELDVVVSTRCRIARNLMGYPFPWRAAGPHLEEIAVACGRAIAALEPHAVRIVRPVSDHDLLRDLLAARYVSYKWTEATGTGGVHVWPDGGGSIMVHEEDHLRIQTLRAGLSLEVCMEQAQGWAAFLGRRLPLAHSRDHGYLTASLCNTGSGMRLSCLLHLAALAATPAMPEALAAARSMNCVVRGAFGEGTPGTGAFVQVSNRCTWGPGAAHAVEQAAAAMRYLIRREREARDNLMNRDGGRTDLIAASEGACDMLLREELPAADVLRCVSVVRLGIATGATSGQLLRTGEWMALAGLMSWAERHRIWGSFERARALAAIRVGLRACLL